MDTPRKLGFGCMRLPLVDPDDQTAIDFETLESMVDAFLEHGFTYFDTALAYHAFTSEAAMRKALVERHPRESFEFVSKLPPRELKCEEDIRSIFTQQLESCGLEYFDRFLIHNVGVTAYSQARRFNMFDQMVALREEGRIKQLGMSFHDSPELLDRILVEQPVLDFVQLQINYLDWEDPGIQARRCYEVVRKHGLPIVVMEPVKGGSLAEIPQEAEALMRAVHPGESPASWAIRYAASLDGVDMVLSGMSDMSMLQDNMSYMEDFEPLNSEEFAVILQVAEIIRAEKAIACTTCRYCEHDCPRGIAIPDYFALYNNVKRAPSKGISSQFVYYLNLAATHGRAGDCIECGACETVCPQHLPIIDLLKGVSETFDGAHALPVRK